MKLGAALAVAPGHASAAGRGDEPGGAPSDLSSQRRVLGRGLLPAPRRVLGGGTSSARHPARGPYLSVVAAAAFNVSCMTCAPCSTISPMEATSSSGVTSIVQTNRLRPSVASSTCIEA